MNTFGTRLRLTTFGESHGPAIGGVIDGFPPGFKIDFEALDAEIKKRSPGSSLLTTQRKESDRPEFLSGINEEGVTLGTSIGFIIRNTDNRGKDYTEIADKYRPNHADYTYEAKYGIREYRGGGRASARETANWVVAGALAYQWLKTLGINISAALSGAGKINFTDRLTHLYSNFPKEFKEVEIPKDIQEAIEAEIFTAKQGGDSVGGSVTCLITGLKAGIGDPVADKLQSRLAGAMLSINAAKSFEYGFGKEVSSKFGSDVLDIFETVEHNKVETRTNFSGGIQGGISNGMPVFFSVSFKPTPTIMRDLPTINQDLQPVMLKMKGRHDPCVAVRAVPVVKAMSALVLADFLL